MNQVLFFQNSKHTLLLTIFLGWANITTCAGPIPMKESIFNFSTQLSHEKYDSLTVNGALNFDDLKIEKMLNVNGYAGGKSLSCDNFIINGALEADEVHAKTGTVNGSLQGNSIHIENDLTVHGSLEGSKIKVFGKTEIYGAISASNSTFDDIEISSSEAEFKGTTTNNITFKKPRKVERIQKITLKNQSIVKGDIVFESGKGEVYMSGDSKVLGTIKGGTIVQS